MLHLTSKEYRILELLLRHRDRTFSKAEIIEHLWSFTEPPKEETVKVHTVNIASRMESHGIADCIQVTEVTYQLLNNKYLLEPRSEIVIKGKGRMKTYFLKGKKEM